MKKVEYIVGSFLGETEIATHILPERTYDPLILDVKAKNRKFAQARISRKTEQTTKKTSEPLDNQ